MGTSLQSYITPVLHHSSPTSLQSYITPVLQHSSVITPLLSLLVTVQEMPEAPRPPAVGSAIVAQSVGRLLKDSCQLKYSVQDINIEPTPHQLRVSQSLAKLNIPAWYTDKQRNVGDNLKWKKSERGSSSWRRKCGTQSCAVSRPTTPDNISLSTSTITLRNLSASRSNFRWSYFGGKENSRVETQQPVNSEVDTATLNTPTLNTAASASSPGSTSIKSTNSFLSYKQPYFGWRSQERLKLNNGLLTSPSQRLASSLLSPPRLHRIAE